LNDPVGLDFDEANDDLYISNYDGHSITKWKIGETQGAFIAGITGQSGNKNNQLNMPHDLALDTETLDLYVSDSSNNRVQK
ncbi:unnamed protein product, partial [Rotaria sp. Silwood1]